MCIRDRTGRLLLCHSADDRDVEVAQETTAEPVHSWLQDAVSRSERTKAAAEVGERTVASLSLSANDWMTAGSSSDIDSAVV